MKNISGNLQGNLFFKNLFWKPAATTLRATKNASAL